MTTSLQAAAKKSRAFEPGGRGGFTLVELLTAMTVLLVMVLVMVGMTNQTNKIWRESRARITAFQQARNAFERVTSNLSQATLTTYLDYYDASQPTMSRADVLRKVLKDHPGDGKAYSLAAAAFKPGTYDRASDLQFVCGQSETGTTPLIKPSTGTVGTRPSHALFFECPLGYVDDPNRDPSSQPFNPFKNLTRTLNAVGYYVEFANASDKTTVLGKQRVPGFITNLPASYRFRLMELNQPSQYLSIYSSRVVYANPGSWFSLAVDPVASSSTTTPPPVTFPVAENIIALVVRPKAANPTPTVPLPTEIAPFYAYDTKQYLTPPFTDASKLSKNQLPPLVQVTLVAIDADSAQRLAAQYGSTPPPLVESTTNPTPPFSDVTTYDADLAALENQLQKQRLTYRTFVTDVSLPGARWSETR